jgi:hypothetical protein
VATGSLEDRVTALELELARLKQQLDGDTPWWKKIWGTFAGDPMYLKAMQEGRKYRQSLRPKPRKRRKK